MRSTMFRGETIVRANPALLVYEDETSAVVEVASSEPSLKASRSSMLRVAGSPVRKSIDRAVRRSGRHSGEYGRVSRAGSTVKETGGRKPSGLLDVLEALRHQGTRPGQWV